MQSRRLGYLLAICLLNTGCSLFESGARNIAVQPAQVFNRELEVKRSKALAHKAWQHIGGDHLFSKDYRRGFLRGYVDYLENGGTGEPPIAPPLVYLAYCRETPTGHMMAEEWFAGFRHGSALAVNLGQRNYITIPISAVYERDRYPQAYSPSDSDPGDDVPVEQLPLPAEELPPPRLIPDGDDPPSPGLPGEIPEQTQLRRWWTPWQLFARQP